MSRQSLLGELSPARGLLGEPSPAARGQDRPLKRRGFYLLHDAGATHEAQRLAEGIWKYLGQPCCVDLPTTAEGLDACLESLAQFSCVLLLQTTVKVIRQPWQLLALHQAVELRIPIICVLQQAERARVYDFEEARLLLSRLQEELSCDAVSEITRVLSSRGNGDDVSKLQANLSTLVPSLISVVYRPDGSSTELAATCRDIDERYERLVAGGVQGTGPESPSGASDPQNALGHQSAFRVSRWLGRSRTRARLFSPQTESLEVEVESWAPSPPARVSSRNSASSRGGSYRELESVRAGEVDE